ncbi:MAG: type VI secretion system tip protein VgrG [Polyangiaceae bacterium]|nr:type VI secretion system tip protein VgrG [Polyangiaceae bacterium]
MQDPILVLGDAHLFVTALDGEERLGEPCAFTLEVTAPEPLDPPALVGAPAAILLGGSFDARVVHGIVVSLTALATSQAPSVRRYRLTVRSPAHLLTLRRRSRVFQDKSVPQIVRQVFEDAGLGGEAYREALCASHPPRRYVTQYDETDLDFVRRLCEEEGLYFSFEPGEGRDAFLLEDSSTMAPKAQDDALALVDASGLGADAPIAYEAKVARSRRPGKVRLRDYWHEQPGVDLEAQAEAGSDAEKAVEIYRAPFGYGSPAEGKRLAGLYLESLRASALAFTFKSTLLALRPGLRQALEVDAGYAGSARPDGECFVVAVRHRFRTGDRERVFAIEAIPGAVPYRLPRVTPRPTIAGVASAFVTGASGEEIHTDDLGRVKVRFHWDREQPFDDKSSLPVRVLQPNLPGPQLIPRVGWEVMVAFEGGDPDRPYVLGRVYDGKWPPPFALPANKTMTALGTVSSPGAACANIFHIDDAAGKEHMVWGAGFDKTTTVANNAVLQTVGFEKLSVTGSQTRTVGANENISVKNAFLETVDSQSISVAGKHDVLVKAAATCKVGSEKVAVGGALVEQVGNPVDGLKGFAEAAVLAGVGQIPGVGTVLSKGYSAAKAVKEGYEKGGLKGALTAVAQQGVGVLADQIPAGDALTAAADAAGLTPWSDKAQKRAGAKEAGGGTGGAAGAAASAAAAAPGHRKIIIDGVMSEAIGALAATTTPGSIKWSGLGVVAIGVGAGHSTKAVMVNQLTGGLSAQTSATLSITAGKAIGRTVGALATSIAGALTESAGGAHHIKAKGALKIDVGGAMTLKGGSVVFQVGSSVVAVHGGGVVIKTDKIVVKGASKQSGKGTMK